MSFFDIIKNIFIVLLFLQLAPALMEGIKKQYARYITPKTQVGVISIRGLLYDSNAYNKQLHTFFENTDIKAVLLKIECPGGASGSSQAIHDELQSLKKEYPKPVIVLVENMCTSGGYYIASAADYIVAPGCALIGSIGASMPYFFQLKKLIEHYNVQYIPMTAGTYKGIGDPFVDITPEEKRLLQDVLNDTYDQFAADIAKNRKLSMAHLTTWADGKIFSGHQAKQIGLVDAVGSAYNAMKILKEKALIEGDIEWVKPTQETSIWNMIAGSQHDDEDTMFGSMITNKLGDLLQEKVIGQMAEKLAPGLNLQ